MISGGFAGGGESSSAQKAHLRSIRTAELGEIQALSKLPRLDTTITFSDSDLEGCQHPHDDPLVVRAIMANTTVHRVLIDNGSSADIIFASAFDKMGVGREKLEPVNTHLRGFFTPFLKCIAGEDTKYVLREVHEGICGNHIGARALAGKVLRQGYYWPTILKDAIDLVKRCRICQEHAKISRLPLEPLTSIKSP